MGDYLPKYKPGQTMTRALTGTVTGGRIITAAGVTAGANATDFIGVAGRDGVSGDRIPVERGGVQRLVASGAIAIGDNVKCGAAGAVATHVVGTDAAERRVGKALEAATDGNELDVLWID